MLMAEQKAQVVATSLDRAANMPPNANPFANRERRYFESLPENLRKNVSFLRTLNNAVGYLVAMEGRKELQEMGA